MSAKPDPTNPEHYNAFTIEPIDAIESWGLGYNLASVVAYIARAGRKPGGEIRTPDSGVFRLAGQAEGVRAGERGSGAGRVDSGDALTDGRRSDLRKALRYLVREITGLDGHPSWNPADVAWTLGRDGEA